MAGLGTVEGAIFGIMGLLLAFTISGALLRFDDRRQLVLQEAAAVTAAYDRLGLFDGQVGRELQSQLKNYVGARVELYRMQHDFLLWHRMEDSPVSSRTSWSAIRTPFGMRRSRPAQGARTSLPAGWRCQPSIACLRSLDCVPGLPKSIRLRSSM